MEVVIHKGIVMVPENMVHSDFVWRIIIYALMFIAFILLMIDFVKFIININKGKIFDKRNISYLNRFGLYLIAIAFLDCIDGFVKEYYFNLVGLTMNGYEITSDWEIPWATFLLGLLALLLARVWKVGMNIKEEQQLTI